MRISQENVYSRRTQGDQQPTSHRKKEVNRLSSINFSFPKSSRILKRKHFKEIASGRQRYLGKALVIDYRSSQNAKLGITVVRRFGNAVQRNLFKRHVREAFRTSRPLLGPYEMIIMPKKGAELFSLEMIAKDLLEFNNESQCSATKGR